jgi:hypothetical protein
MRGFLLKRTTGFEPATPGLGSHAAGLDTKRRTTTIGPRPDYARRLWSDVPAEHDESDRVLGALVLAEGFLGEGGYEALLGDDWREKLEAAEVTFADDDHASIPPLNEDDDGTELVREDGEWLIVFEED